MKECFYCKIEKPLSEFNIDRRKYQLKADKGTCKVCNECYREKSIKDKSVIFFNFDIDKFEIIKFDTEQEVINYLDEKSKN